MLEKFKRVIYNQYEIDPSYSYATAGLTWCCGLKYTKIKLETLQDIDMILMFESQIRGGYSGCLGSRHIKVNNKYMKNYDIEKPSNYLIYYDVNNLYGWSMIQQLPIGNFRWEDEKYYKTNKPCIVEVDLEYNEETKMKTYKYPLMPEKKIYQR